jgi:hypothetical protein
MMHRSQNNYGASRGSNIDRQKVCSSNTKKNPGILFKVH